MIVTILGKRWKLRFCQMPSLEGEKPDHGECDHPEKRAKQIRINSSLADRLQLEAILHESLHAADWSKDEEWVEETALDLSVILWRLGYRR